MTFLEHYTKEQIEDFVKQSHNTREVLMRMGRSANSGSNTLALAVYLKENHIDTSHFKSHATPYTPDEIFIEHSPVTQGILHKYYTQGNYSEYKCAICGLAPFWNGNCRIRNLWRSAKSNRGVFNESYFSRMSWQAKISAWIRMA